jgi:hypothetical protein
MRIRILIQFQIQGFDDQKMEKIYSWNFLKYFCDQKWQFYNP